MSGQYVIGVDQGTQTTKSVMLDVNGNLIGESTCPVALSTPKPNWVVQDVDEVYGSVLHTIKQAMASSSVDPKDVKCIAVDSQICSMIAIDDKWQHMDQIISHLDTRSLEQRDRLLSKDGKKIMDSNGQNPYIAQKLLWYKETDEKFYKRIYKALLVNSYIVGRLAGLKADQAFVDTTCMGVYGWSDIRRFSWDPAMATQLGLDVDKAPLPAKPWKIIGELTEKVARQCGLVPGIPIAAGLGDAIAGWIGVGAVEPGTLVDTSGTANHLGICVDRYQPDTQFGVLSHYPSAIPGQWYAIGFTAGTGRSHSWFVDELFRTESNEHYLDNDRAYSVLDEKATHIQPGAEGLFFSPHFGGRMCPYQPRTRGAWLGLTWKHTREHLYRSILEAIAYEYHSFLNISKKLYPDITYNQVMVIGGGAKSALWNQIKADVLNVPYGVCSGYDFAPFGAAIIAGYAIGIFQDIADTALRFRKIINCVKPRSDVHTRYQILAKHYNYFLDQLQVIYEHLGSSVSGNE